jgi:hypothetical protein
MRRWTKTQVVPEAELLFDIGPLRVEARPRPSYFDRWYDASVHVLAHPFTGVVQAVLEESDLEQFASNLETAEIPGRLVLGGGRACEIVLIFEWQNGVEDDLLAVECAVTPSGDDPYPRIEFVAFDVLPFFAGTASRLRALITLQPWPTPD